MQEYKKGFENQQYCGLSQIGNDQVSGDYWLYQPTTTTGSLITSSIPTIYTASAPANSVTLTGSNLMQLLGKAQ